MGFKQYIELYRWGQLLILAPLKKVENILVEFQSQSYYYFFTAVHSLTRCPAKGLLRSYYCPRSYDSPDQTRCCSWYGAPSCCLPGGLFCSEQQGGHVRDYCPGPYDGKDNRVCCIKNDKAKCCQVFLR